METKRKAGLDFTAGSILKEFLVYTVPIVLTNVIPQLYSLVEWKATGDLSANHKKKRR